jgi:hypothetical protein
MILIKARAFLAITVIQVIVLAGLFMWSMGAARARMAEEIPQKQELVQRLELTDLAIWTEARYTRHPSQADFFAPFQDGPSSLEHFPAGSVVAAPDRSRAAAADR